MRRYIIVFGILLILSIIDLALAAPVLVQDKRQGWVDVIDIPEDAKTALGKRVGADAIEQLWDKWYFEGLWGKPKESPGAPASSISTPSGSAPSGSEPSGPDHASTSVIEGPAPGSEPSRLAPSGPDHGSTNIVKGPAPGSEPSGLAPLGLASSSSEPSSSIPLGPDHGSTNVVEGPAQDSGLSHLSSSVPILSRPDRGSKNVIEEPSGSILSGPDHGSSSIIDGPAQGPGLSRLSSSAPIPIPPRPDRWLKFEEPAPNPADSRGQWMPRPLTDSTLPSSSPLSSSSSSSGSEDEELFDWEPEPESSEPLKWSQAPPPGWKVSNWHKPMGLYTIPEEPWGFTEEDYNSEHEYAALQPNPRPSSPKPSSPSPPTDYDYYNALSLTNAPLSRPGSPTGFGADPEDKVAPLISPSTEAPHHPLPPPLVEHQLSVPGSLTMSENEELNRPPSSQVSSSNLNQPVNAEDALYSWKAKGKQPMDATQ